MAANIYASMAGVALDGIASAVDNTQAKMTWNEQYDLQSQWMTRKQNAMNAINVNELNLHQIGVEKNLTNAKIRMAQDDAEANVKLQAATSGVTGGSVQQSQNQTNVNMGLAIGQNQLDTQAKKQAYIDQAYQLRYNMDTIPVVRPKVYKSTVLDTIAKMAPIIGEKEFLNRATNAFDAWNSSGNAQPSELDGNDYGGRHGDLDGNGGG